MWIFMGEHKGSVQALPDIWCYLKWDTAKLLIEMKVCQRLLWFIIMVWLIVKVIAISMTAVVEKDEE